MASADDVPTTTMAHDSDCKCSDLRSANEELTQKIANLEYQLNEAKSEIAVAQFVKESVFELEREKTGLGEEMATLQQVSFGTYLYPMTLLHSVFFTALK